MNRISFGSLFVIITAFLALTPFNCVSEVLMEQPQIKVLGVYRLPVTEELFNEQFAILYGYPIMSKSERVEAERQCREQLASVVLVEVIVQNRNDKFDVGDFVQPDDRLPKENWQAPWAEAYLTQDGQNLAVERWSRPPISGDLRVAFFIHYWQPDKPLRTSYGDISCPPVQEMPERLSMLVPYEPVD